MQNKTKKQGFKLPVNPFCCQVSLQLMSSHEFHRLLWEYTHTSKYLVFTVCIYCASTKDYEILDPGAREQGRINLKKSSQTHRQYNLLTNIFNKPQTHQHFEILKDLNTYLHTYHFYLQCIKVEPYPWKMHLWNGLEHLVPQKCHRK